MLAAFSSMEIYCFSCSKKVSRTIPQDTTLAHELSSRRHVTLCSSKTIYGRRFATLHVSAWFLAISNALVPFKTNAEEKGVKKNEESEGVLGSFKSFLDPNEKTKSGKVLPKAYLKIAREVVKTLKESLGENSEDVAKFRKTADAAKESIKEYLSRWRGQPEVAHEESYVALEKAIKSLASFYQKSGPFAVISQEVKETILDDLNTAEANL